MSEPAERPTPSEPPSGNDPVDPADPGPGTADPDPIDPQFVAASRRTAAVGTVIALICLLGVIIAPALSFVGFSLWAVLTITTALVMVAICGFQFSVWNRVQRGDASVWRLQTMSWAGHLLSYLIALLGLVAGLVTMSVDGPLSLAFWIALLAGLALLLAQSTAAVQFLRRGGPPGTIPAHIRRLIDATSRLGS
ncbi:hypothetical protein [Naumannella halotolerans]|uniref:Uncharacterized protein n=1 Tax=Naumannella halotolerans TaxID=993414 RepID=A0A4R7IYZ1_9ACTN|nr:hypothetical protein [Naumannella halotolerans]TDT30011.1 hypothetical protein CLV29_3034 [Naumannella halotolerans]